MPRIYDCFAFLVLGEFPWMAFVYTAQADYELCLFLYSSPLLFVLDRNRSLRLHPKIC